MSEYAKRTGPGLSGSQNFCARFVAVVALRGSKEFSWGPYLRKNDLVALDNFVKPRVETGRRSKPRS
jgi:hypothetical protein